MNYLNKGMLESKVLYLSIILDGNHIPDVSELPQSMNQQDERQESEIQNAIADNIGEHTEGCQTDDDCGYPLYSCYEAELVDNVVELKECLVTWWFILILVVICLVVLICIIALIVVCCCKACC